MTKLIITGKRKYISYMRKHLRKEHPSTKKRMYKKGGTAPQFSTQIIFFLLVFQLFIIGMVVSVGYNQVTSGFDMEGFSFGNVIESFIELGYWNVLIFSPLFLTVAFVGMALAFPDWA